MGDSVCVCVVVRAYVGEILCEPCVKTIYTSNSLINRDFLYFLFLDLDLDFLLILLRTHKLVSPNWKHCSDGAFLQKGWLPYLIEGK